MRHQLAQHSVHFDRNLCETETETAEADHTSKRRMGGQLQPEPRRHLSDAFVARRRGLRPRRGRERPQSYAISAEGQTFLKASRAAIEDIEARMGSGPRGRPEGVPVPIIRATENLKLALRLRLKQGPLDPKVVEQISNALDAAAQTVERS